MNDCFTICFLLLKRVIHEGNLYLIVKITTKQKACSHNNNSKGERERERERETHTHTHTYTHTHTDDRDRKNGK